jgi:hypothetical protein
MRYIISFLLICTAASAQFAGTPKPWPFIPTTVGTSLASTLVDASGEMVAFCGPVETPNKGTKSIRKVGINLGTVVKTGSSVIRVSLQNAATATGPAPGRPDETQDQTADIAAADYSSNAYVATGNLSADRSVAYGEQVCVVAEYSTFAGGDSFNIRSYPSYNMVQGSTWIASKLGGTWAGISGTPIVHFEFSDGTLGTLHGALPGLTTTSGITLNTGTTPDEVGNAFTVDQTIKVSSIFGSVTVNNASSDFDLILYNGSTSLASCSYDANAVYRLGSYDLFHCLISEQTLTTGNTYRVAIKPTTTNSVMASYVNVNDTLMRAMHPSGANVQSTTRTDAGSWSESATRYYNVGVGISAVPAGSTGGGSYTWVQ